MNNISYSSFIKTFQEWVQTNSAKDSKIFEEIKLAGTLFDALNKVKSDNGEEEVLDETELGGKDINELIKEQVKNFKRMNDPIYNVICLSDEDENNPQNVIGKWANEIILNRSEKLTKTESALASALKIEPVRDANGKWDIYSIRNKIYKALMEYKSKIGNDNYLNYDKAKNSDILKPAFGIVDGEWHNKQGKEKGDCFLLNAFSYIKKHPELHNKIVQWNANGDVTITFLGGDGSVIKSELSEPQSVTISRSDIINAKGYSSDPDAIAIEMAYEKIFGKENLDNGGNASLAFKRLVGRCPSETISIKQLDSKGVSKLMKLLKELNGNYITLSAPETFYDKNGNTIYGHHAISIENVKGQNLILSDSHDSDRCYSIDKTTLSSFSQVHINLPEIDPKSPEYYDIINKIKELQDYQA